MLALFLAGHDGSANLAPGTVHGMEVGVSLPGTNCREQSRQIVRCKLLRSESYYVSCGKVALDRPSLLRAGAGSMRWRCVVTKEYRNTAIDVRLSHMDVREQDVCPQALVGQYKVRGTVIWANCQLEGSMRARER